MNKDIIHQSAEEQSADNSRKILEAIKAIPDTTSLHKETNEALDIATQGIHSIEHAVRSIPNQIELLKENIKKAEEVKSATLLVNKSIKAIPKPLPPPTQMKVEVVGAELITIKGDKGDKGDVGNTGDKGEQGPQGDQGIQGIKGEKGSQGEKGRDGIDGLDGKDGINGKDGDRGSDGSPDSPDEIIDKVNKSKKRINPKQIKGLLDIIDSVDQIVNYPKGGGAIVGGFKYTWLDDGVRISDHVTEINFGTGISASYADGRITLTASVSSTVYSETPTGAVDGSNTSYTVLHAVTTVINFSINGQFIHPAEYTAVGTTITFSTALPADLSGKGFTIVYQ